MAPLSNVESTILRLQECLQNVHNEDNLRDCLNQLNEIDMSIDWDLFARTKIGVSVFQFRNHAVVGEQATALRNKWKQQHKDHEQQQQQQQQQPLQCTGRAAQALEIFRKRFHELEQQGQRKPDMVAFKELREKWTPRCHGEIDGVPIGLKVSGRGEAAILGIHRNILSGIDSLKDEPCYAVCISGGYADDNDQSSDGTVIYTGSGGNKAKKQVKDQAENQDNASLIRSMGMKTPIRLLRKGNTKKGKVPEYYYDGLYQCVNYTYEKSKDGPKVYKFVLKPITGKNKHSVTVKPDNRLATTNLQGSRRRLALNESERLREKKENERERKRQRRDSTKTFV